MSLRDHEIIAFGVGFAGGLLIGAYVGAEGHFPDGSWVLLGSFVAGSFLVYQVRQNAINAERAERVKWRDQQRRVLTILLAQAEILRESYEFIVSYADQIKADLTEQLALEEKSYALRVKMMEMGGPPAAYSEMTRDYYPAGTLAYFDDHPGATEYLPLQVVAALGRVQMSVRQITAARLTSHMIPAVVSSFDASMARLSSAAELLGVFHALVKKHVAMLDSSP